MTRILAKIALMAVAATVPVHAAAQAALEGKWANPHRSVIVNVAPCGSAFCGTVSWANGKNREKGVQIAEKNAARKKKGRARRSRR